MAVEIAPIEPLTKECWICEKTGKCCVPFSRGSGFYLKIQANHSTTVKMGMPPYAIWDHLRGCVGAERTWSAAIETANRLHADRVRRFLVRPIVEST